jgi:hypothetical protein
MPTFCKNSTTSGTGCAPAHIIPNNASRQTRGRENRLLFPSRWDYRDCWLPGESFEASDVLAPRASFSRRLLPARAGDRRGRIRRCPHCVAALSLRRRRLAVVFSRHRSSQPLNLLPLLIFPYFVLAFGELLPLVFTQLFDPEDDDVPSLLRHAFFLYDIPNERHCQTNFLYSWMQFVWLHRNYILDWFDQFYCFIELSSRKGF